MNQWLNESAALTQALPWLTLTLFALPLVILASRGIYPHTPLLLLAIAPCALSAGLLLSPALFPLVATMVIVADTLLLVVAAVDLLRMPGSKALSAQREVARIASLRTKQRVTLTVTNHSARSMTVWIRDDVPQQFEANPQQFALHLAGRTRSTMHYEFTARRRGAFTLDEVHLRLRSMFGLWKRHLTCPVRSVVHVYPDMGQLAEYAVLARTNRLSLMGVRRTRRIGQDNEFERLRDFALDDNYKHIDWRATARRNRLTVKDFQTNQSQRVVFLLDCGRMMTNEASGLTLLDHALNAMLMLAFVALRQGDSVGLICFSDRIHTYVPPRGGMAQMNRLLHASFDRFPQLVESRYDQAFLYLASHCRKRSLVVLVTNVIDEVNSFQIQQYLGTLVGRHLPLSVLLRDHRLFDAADVARPAGSELYRAAAAAEILSWRHQVLTDLQHHGVLSLDVFPEEMAAPLVNRYLEIKARHLL